MVDGRMAQGTGDVRPRDVARIVVTQALFAVAVLVVINARRHDWELVALGEIMAAGLAGVLAALLFARDR